MTTQVPMMSKQNNLIHCLLIRPKPMLRSVITPTVAFLAMALTNPQVTSQLGKLVLSTSTAKGQAESQFLTWQTDNP